MSAFIAALSAVIVFVSLVHQQDWLGVLAFCVLVRVAGGVLIATGRELQSVSEWLDG